MMLDRIISVSNRTTVFRDGGNAVKVYRASYPKSSILNEGMNLTLAEELGLPVPQFRQITTVENRWAMIMDYIAGKTFLRMLTESPLKTDALLSRWTALQRTIHEKRCAALPQVNDLAAQRIEASGLPSDLIRRLSARLQTENLHFRTRWNPQAERRSPSTGSMQCRDRTKRTAHGRTF